MFAFHWSTDAHGSLFCMFSLYSIVLFAKKFLMVISSFLNYLVVLQ